MKLFCIMTALAVSLATSTVTAGEAPPATPAPAQPSATAPVASPSVPVAEPAAVTPALPGTVSSPPAPAPGATPSLLPSGTFLAGPKTGSTTIKLGYIDFTKIAEKSKTALKAKNSVTAAGDKLKKQLTAKGKKLETMKKSLEAQAEKMNQLEREAKAKEFQAKVKEYQDAVQNAEKEMAKQEETVTRKLLDQVTKAVKEFGEQNGYTLIAATKDLIYFDGNHPLHDVTDDVIKKLDK